MTQRLNHNKTAPEGMKALGNVHAYVAASGLPPRVVDLVYLRCSQINTCAFCIDAHARDLLKGGMPVETVLLVSAWREADPLFTDEEKAALAWAETVTLVAENHVPDAAFAAASAVFEPKQLADLTIAIGLINSYNRLALAFRTQPRTAYLAEHHPSA